MKRKTLLMMLPFLILLAENKENPILYAMEKEIKRAMDSLSIQEKPTPYFILVRITEEENLIINTDFGVLTSFSKKKQRGVYAEVRVGSYEFDNTGLKKRGLTFFQEGWKFLYTRAPLDNDEYVVRHQLWSILDYLYKKALSDYEKRKRERILEVEEDEIPDFSKEPPRIFIGEEKKAKADANFWKEKLKKLSKEFKKYPFLTKGQVGFSEKIKNRYIVNSEGTKIQEGTLIYEIKVWAETITKDGFKLKEERKFYAWDENSFDEEEIKEAIREIGEILKKMKDAEKTKPFNCPVLITSSGASVLLQKALESVIIGDRELVRETGMSERINELVLPNFLSVYDDPQLKEFNGHALPGYYRYDDEGVPSQRVELIKNGVLKNFLMSRTPIKKVLKSNGHARGGIWEKPKPRISNLFVESSITFPLEELKEKLIAECKRTGKPYGILINSLYPDGRNFIATEAYRIYTDGREEPIKGVKITLFSSLDMLNRIIATGDEVKQKRARIPSILISTLEIGKAKRTTPYILSPPGFKIR